MNRLEGRVALVTGALRGIGRAIAERLQAEGASVVYADLADERDAVEASSGDERDYIRLDVVEEAGWRIAVKTIEARHGRLDILVANAGIIGNAPVRTMPLMEWRRTMQINVDGVFLATKHCSDLLGRSGRDWAGGASIINMSSIAGLVGMPLHSSYNASKGAVRLFTKSTALEFAAEGMPIRVNSIHPGFVETPLLIDSVSAELLGAFTAATPLRRLAQPREIAAAVAFLASDDASYMTGSELVIDGGYTAQ